MKKKFLIPIIVVLALAIVFALAYVLFMRPLAIPGMGSGKVENEEGITLSTEFPVYDRSCNYVTLIIKNNSGENAEFGDSWLLEKKVLGGWAEVPFRPNNAFNSILYILNDGGEKVMTCYLTNFIGEIADGEYRIVKEINDTLYTAEFEIGESEITAEKPFGYEPIGTINKYGYDEAIADGCVNLTTGENEDKLLYFLNAVQTSEREAQVRFAEINSDGELVLTDIFRSRSGAYRVTEWNQDKLANTRMMMYASSSVGIINEYAMMLEDIITTDHYSYLVTDGKQIYLSNTSEYTERDDDILIVPKDLMSAELKSFIGKEYRAEEEYVTLTIWSNGGLRSATKSNMPDSDNLEFWVNEFSENGIGTRGQTLVLKKENLNDPDSAKIVDFVWNDDNSLMIIAEDGKLGGNTNYYYEFRSPDTFEIMSYTHSVHGYIVSDGEVLIPE